MSRKAVCVLFLLCITLIVSPITPGVGQAGSPAGLPPDPIVQFMIDQVDASRIYMLTGDLSGEWPVKIGGQPYTIKTRNSFSGEPITKAGQYLYEFYQNLSLDVAYDYFDFFDRVLANIVAERTGSLYPKRIFLITSHYDNAPGGELAPGADDNASGTVAVMIAAEILSRYDFACTLRFVNFAGEEQGLEGSEAYAEQIYNAGEDLDGVLNLDMIAWNKPGSQPAMDLHAKEGVPGTIPLAELFEQVVEAYNLNLETEIITNGTDRSDHASFWTYDFPAILAIEDFGDFNPFYHTPDDSLENLDDQMYFTDMVRASIATLAHMGCMIDPGWGTLSGQVTDQLSGLPVSRAAIFLHNPVAGYTRTVLSSQTGGFQVSLPAARHQLTADALGYSLTDIQEISIQENQELEFDIQLRPTTEYPIFLPINRHAPRFAP